MRHYVDHFHEAPVIVLVSLLLSRLTGTLRWLTRHARSVNRFAGVVLIVLVVVMLVGSILTLLYAALNSPTSAGWYWAWLAIGS